MGTYHPRSLHLRALDGCTTGLAIDQRNGELFVSDCGGGTQVYELGNHNPLRSLDETFPADSLAIGAIGGRQVPFAPDLRSSAVEFYFAHARSPFYTLESGVTTTIGVAYKPAGV